MPIWLRKFTMSQLNDHYSNQKKEMEASKAGKKGNKTLVSADGKINTPEFAQESKAYKGKTSYK